MVEWSPISEGGCGLRLSNKPMKLTVACGARSLSAGRYTGTTFVFNAFCCGVASSRKLYRDIY
jgi:hypothetical protein